MKKVFVLLINFVFIMSLMACSKIQNIDANNVQVNDLNNYPVIIEGVTFSKSPKNVVSLSPAITEILFEIGVGDKIVGKSDYCNYPEKASEISSVGSPAHPNIDAIIALKPELVVTQSPIASIDEETLKKNGIKVLYLPAPKTYYELLDIYGALAKTFFGNNKSDAIVEEKTLSLYNALYNAENLSLTNKYLCIITEQNAVATGDTLAGNILSVFGDNIAKDKLQCEMTVEEIVAASPDLIFVANDIDTANLPEKISTLLSKEGTKVIKIDYSFFERPTSRLSTVIEQISSEISPPLESQEKENSELNE